MAARASGNGRVSFRYPRFQPSAVGFLVLQSHSGESFTSRGRGNATLLIKRLRAES